MLVFGPPCIVEKVLNTFQLLCHAAYTSLFYCSNKIKKCMHCAHIWPGYIT